VAGTCETSIGTTAAGQKWPKSPPPPPPRAAGCCCRPLLLPARACGMEPHPFGVAPLGNCYALCGATGVADAVAAGASGDPVRTAGLGAFGRLPDELLLALLGALPAAALGALCCASRACRAFAAAEELWRAATLDAFGGDVRFVRTWRETYRRAERLRALRGRAGVAAAAVPTLAHQQSLMPPPPPPPLLFPPAPGGACCARRSRRRTRRTRWRRAWSACAPWGCAATCCSRRTCARRRP
jgi:hypothetical protein